MSAIIYETINNYNKQNGILPYRYIGSDQHNNPKYLGSNKKLLEDIKKIGIEYFEKRVIQEFSDKISNIELRQIESKLQKSINAAKNPEYYNRTNSSYKGYIETKEEKKLRLEKRKLAYIKWWNNLSEKDKNIRREAARIEGLKAAKAMKNKTYEEIYGDQEAKIQKLKHTGKNNGMSKKVLEISTGKIFNTLGELILYLGYKPYGSSYAKIRSLCKEAKTYKFL